MSTKANVAELDGHLGFIRNEISFLRRQAKPWADTKAERMEQIMVILSDLRREKQMTGMGGRRIDE